MRWMRSRPATPGDSLSTAAIAFRYLNLGNALMISVTNFRLVARPEPARPEARRGFGSRGRSAEIQLRMQQMAQTTCCTQRQFGLESEPVQGCPLQAEQNHQHSEFSSHPPGTPEYLSR